MRTPSSGVTGFFDHAKNVQVAKTPISAFELDSSYQRYVIPYQSARGQVADKLDHVVSAPVARYHIYTSSHRSTVPA
jgi:hypothetical protein